MASLGISSLECSLDLMRPSLASWPHTCAAASVTSLMHLEICHVGLSNIIFHLSVDCVWQENFGGVYGVVRKPLISALERAQVKLCSCTLPFFQLISLVREAADRFSLGVILGLTLLSPNSSTPLRLRIWSTANCLSWRSELASRETKRHSGWAFQAPVLT